MMKIHSIFPFFHFWLMSLIGLFAVGADALGILGGDSAVVNLPEGGDVEEPEAISTESGEATDSEKTELEGAAKPEISGPKLAKPLSTGASTALKGVREADPKAWKELNSRLWALDGIDKKIAEHFPEGLDEAVQLKGTVDNFLSQIGARDLNELGGEVQNYRLTDKKIISGDTSFINDLPAEAQQGIFKMMPNFMGQWATRDQEGYDRYFASVLVNTMRETEFMDNLRDSIRDIARMGLDDADNKTIHDRLSAMFDWINRLKAKATAAPEKKDLPAADDTALKAREQSVKQQERVQRLNRIGSENSPYVVASFTSALKSLCGGKIPANINHQEVFVRARHNLAVGLGMPFDKKIGEYVDAGDEAGAVKYARQQFTEERLTQAITKAYNWLYPKASLGGKRPAVPGAQPPANGKPDQFAAINYNPKPSSIDFLKTTELAKKLNLSRNQLLAQGKGVLKSGKAVQWAHDAEQEA